MSGTNIDPPPHYFRGTEMATFDFETDSAAAAALVPEGLVLAHEPARARVMFADFTFSTLGPYREAILAISCLWEGRRVLYCPYLIVTGDVGLIAGREIWGAPKLLGDIGFTRANAVISCHVDRPAGLNRIATGVIRPRDPLVPRGGEDVPMVFLKVIPSPEQGAAPEVCELVEVTIESSVHLGSDGRPMLFSGPGSLSFDSRSPADPWAALPVNRMVHATYGRFDSVLKHGRVLHRYDTAAEASPSTSPVFPRR
ncbi:acetoacetate decarboxylase family protein [Streptomyces sp. JH14]|uniref:acetoacetate decarboxylase family protein n=1 Tax=Streptomyces sp. JH14 TaxID=2793630 RepID=UPI0023F6EE4C|nr:acetoacetate decarboxylase family protein [Streptomyces sp. JH14]MDF6046142.1 acetoacetate decarboxylase family protein [Streptomyces sp. JH14]